MATGQTAREARAAFHCAVEKGIVTYHDRQASLIGPGMMAVRTSKVAGFCRMSDSPMTKRLLSVLESKLKVIHGALDLVSCDKGRYKLGIQHLFQGLRRGACGICGISGPSWAAGGSLFPLSRRISTSLGSTGGSAFLFGDLPCSYTRARGAANPNIVAGRCSLPRPHRTSSHQHGSTWWQGKVYSIGDPSTLSSYLGRCCVP